MRPLHCGTSSTVRCYPYKANARRGARHAHIYPERLRSVVPSFCLFVSVSAQDVLRDNLERAVELLADTLINPRDTVEEVEEQKAVRT